MYIDGERWLWIPLSLNELLSGCEISDPARCKTHAMQIVEREDKKASFHSFPGDPGGCLAAEPALSSGSRLKSEMDKHPRTRSGS